MKIGILTFHEIYNPGAFLQTYGTQALVRRLGHESEVIDYNPPSHRYHPLTHVRKLGLRFILRRKQWMDAYLRDKAFAPTRRCKLTLSPNFRERTEIANVFYDAVLVGADIVWNFKEKRLGQDPVYFGEGLNTEKLVAFAPSCGNCSASDPIPEYVVSGLKRFSSVAVRDRNTADVVCAALDYRPKVICDPSFHLLNELGHSEKKTTDRDYILVYLLPGHTSSSLISDIRKLSISTGIPVHAVYYRQKWADRNIMSLNPFQWLEKIRGARYVFTNTFHGTIFSAFLRSDFVIEMNDLIREKTLDMVLGCDLKKRLYNGEYPVPELLKRSVDFDRVHRFFRAQARDAEMFLREALGVSTSDK